MATVGELLDAAVAELRAGGSESPRLDAELLLAHVLRTDRTTILAHPEAPVGEGARATFRAALERRLVGEPVAYIRGVKEFFGLAFAVDRRALIPRPETERLVELALARIAARLTGGSRPGGGPPLRVLDVGTGCGAVAVALAATFRRRGYGAAVRLVASDISADALALAIENAVGHGVADAIDFRLADLLEPATAADTAAAAAPGGGPVDLLVANLPYVRSDVVPLLPIAARFEPPVALDGGPDGLAVIRRLLVRLPDVLGPGGIALLEIGADQSEAIVAVVNAALPGWPLTVHPDLAGQPRVAEIGRPTAGGEAPPARRRGA